MEYHNCRVCSHIYETHTDNDSRSKDELEYARYLGFCSAGCYDKLTEDDKTKEHLFAYLEGDIRKRNKLLYLKSPPAAPSGR